MVTFYIFVSKLFYVFFAEFDVSTYNIVSDFQNLKKICRSKVVLSVLVNLAIITLRSIAWQMLKPSDKSEMLLASFWYINNHVISITLNTVVL